MPPALEEESSSSEAEIAYRSKNAEPEVDEEVEVKAEEEGDEEPDEYVVEKILSHKTARGQVVYRVKWQGYDKEEDLTWEPEENLEGAMDVLKEYWEENGGRPGGATKGAKGAKRGRKSAGAAETKTEAAPSAKKPRVQKEWEPPQGSWENDVQEVDTVSEDRDHTGLLVRTAYLLWNNGKKTQHPLHQIYVKCPRKMLEYYESHLVFQPGDEDKNDDGDVLNGDKEVIMKTEY